VAHKLNEAALLTDACLAQGGPGPTGEAAERLHRLVFDSEQAVQGVVRAVEALAAEPLPGDVRANVASMLRAVREQPEKPADAGTAALESWLHRRATEGAHADDRAALWVYRLVVLRHDLALLARSWRTDLSEPNAAETAAPFASSVSLLAGKLPGSTLLGRRAVVGGALGGWWARWKVSPHLRTALQTAVAVAIATPVGDLIDPDRFYWADIGVLIIVSATTTTHDRLRKLGQRFVGTVVGGAIGIGMVHVLGSDHSVSTAALAVAALGVGIYCLGTYYAVWVVGLVVALCQVYAVSTDVTATLLLYRLAENMIGAVIGILVALVVFPISTRAVVRYGLQSFFGSLHQLLTDSGAALVGRGGRDRLRRDARAVDNAAYELDQVLEKVFSVSRRSRQSTDELRVSLTDIAHNSRELARTAAQGNVPSAWTTQVEQIVEGLGDLIDRLLAATSGGLSADSRAWLRQAGAIDRISAAIVDSSAPATERLRHALHHLGILEDALAPWAEDAGITVAGDSHRELALRRRAGIPVTRFGERLAARTG